MQKPLSVLVTYPDHISDQDMINYQIPDGVY